MNNLISIALGTKWSEQNEAMPCFKEKIMIDSYFSTIVVGLVRGIEVRLCLASRRHN